MGCRAFKTNLESENQPLQTADEIVAELILSEWEDRRIGPLNDN